MNKIEKALSLIKQKLPDSAVRTELIELLDEPVTWVPTRQELVLVWNNDEERAVPAVYSHSLENANFPHIDSLGYHWKNCKPHPTHIHWEKFTGDIPDGCLFLVEMRNGAVSTNHPSCINWSQVKEFASIQ